MSVYHTKEALAETLEIMKREIGEDAFNRVYPHLRAMWTNPALFRG
jgi:hypothetical protein